MTLVWDAARRPSPRLLPTREPDNEARVQDDGSAGRQPAAGGQSRTHEQASLEPPQTWQSLGALGTMFQDRPRSYTEAPAEGVSEAAGRAQGPRRSSAANYTSIIYSGTRNARSATRWAPSPDPTQMINPAGAGPRRRTGQLDRLEPGMAFSSSLQPRSDGVEAALEEEREIYSLDRGWSIEDVLVDVDDDEDSDGGLEDADGSDDEAFEDDIATSVDFMEVRDLLQIVAMGSHGWIGSACGTLLVCSSPSPSKDPSTGFHQFLKLPTPMLHAGAQDENGETISLSEHPLFRSMPRHELQRLEAMQAEASATNQAQQVRAPASNMGSTGSVYLFSSPRNPRPP